MENFDFDLNSEETQRVIRLEQLEHDFYNLQAITDKWGFLRQIYMELLPWIMERAAQNVVVPINPYPVDWGRYFSPIEVAAWHSIRGHYMALYPQFPVFNHFVDFANPYLRIGLELDGKDFHDPVKDAKRDELFARHGWRIFRVTGKEAHAKFKHLDEIQENLEDSTLSENADVHHWLFNTCDGVVYAIKQVYFLKRTDSELYDLYCATLDRHRLADFEI